VGEHIGIPGVVLFLLFAYQKSVKESYPLNSMKSIEFNGYLATSHIIVKMVSAPEAFAPIKTTRRRMPSRNVTPERQMV
jgi:hypothetical protein